MLKSMLHYVLIFLVQHGSKFRPCSSKVYGVTRCYSSCSFLCISLPAIRDTELLIKLLVPLKPSIYSTIYKYGHIMFCVDCTIIIVCLVVGEVAGSTEAKYGIV